MLCFEKFCEYISSDFTESQMAYEVYKAVYNFLWNDSPSRYTQYEEDIITGCVDWVGENKPLTVPTAKDVFKKEFFMCYHLIKRCTCGEPIINNGSWRCHQCDTVFIRPRKFKLMYDGSLVQYCEGGRYNVPWKEISRNRYVKLVD